MRHGQPTSFSIDIAFAVMNMAEGPPGVNEQKAIISHLLQKNFVKGDVWYLIDIKWMKQWKEYVGYDSSDAAGQKDLHPGPIDNSGILKDFDPTQLKDSLMEELDYLLLPQEGWEKMSSWYGSIEDQEPIMRQVVEHGLFVKSLKVEVYLTEFRLCEYNNMDHIVTAKFSKGDTVETIEKKMRELFDIAEDKETRLWNKYMSNSYEPLHEKTKMVEDAELYQGQLLVIEQKNEDGSWSFQQPTPKTRHIANRYVRHPNFGESLLQPQDVLEIKFCEEGYRGDGDGTSAQVKPFFAFGEWQNIPELASRENFIQNLDRGRLYSHKGFTTVEEIERSQEEEIVKKQLIRGILSTKHNMAPFAIESVLALRDNYEISECIIAVKAVGGDLQRARDYFKECATCYTKFVMDKLVTLITCQCLVCTECFTTHFTTLAQTTSCMYKFSCPVCSKPVLDTCSPDEFQMYFSYLDMTLKLYLKEKDFELYNKKLNSWELMSDKYFRWCVHGCRSGFLNEGGNQKIQCPECKRYQCFNCQKPWSVEHEELTCEQFVAWKRTNDPEYQQQVEVAHLKESGITCPKCKMYYELAKGGCMHFKCPRCLNEFCCGCNLPFRRYPRCQQLPSCKSKGLHAHHPRDCLYYLRDEECYSLQRLLQIHSIDYSHASSAVTAGVGGGPSNCPVKEQNEGPNGLEDAICGKPIIGQCGLCENHYKEYLVGLINQSNLDPVVVCGLESLQAILRRNDKEIPAQVARETQSAYCARLRQEIQQRLPLRPRNAQGVCM